MKYIVLEIPNHLFATKTAYSAHPDTGEFVKYINDFITLRVAPDTIIGESHHLKTTYEKLQNLCDFRRTYTDPSEPDFIDLLKYFVSKGVKFLPDYSFKRGKGYFALDLFVKLTNAEYTSQVPIGIYGYSENTTWENIVNQNLMYLVHSNNTHKFIYYNPTASDAEFKALLNSPLTILSLREFQEQQQLDLQQ